MILAPVLLSKRVSRVGRLPEDDEEDEEPTRCLLVLILPVPSKMGGGAKCAKQATSRRTSIFDFVERDSQTPTLLDVSPPYLLDRVCSKRNDEVNA